MCLRCAKGYQLEKGVCTALKKSLIPPEANYYRYVIYAGLCISACIILHNSVYMASLVGLAVALYIGGSEYLMRMHLNQLPAEQQQQQQQQKSMFGAFQSLS